MKYFIFIFLSIFLSSQAFAENIEPSNTENIESSSGIDILEVLDRYSTLNGVKFVTDPRIKGKVTMIGFKLDEIDKTDLNNILLIHNMVAYKKSDVVYIVPVQRVGEFGEKWETSN